MACLPFVPNEGQEAALDSLAGFLSSRAERPCFLLTGYAGTGKTSLVSALTRAMAELQQPAILLAPTGRAAKVMSHYAGFPAYTIHKWIYHSEDNPLGEPSFSLGFNKDHHTLFIVDEASMIGHNLLRDLIQFIYMGEGCRLLLLGDDAQLPPVEYQESPALQVSELESRGLTVTYARLTEVARQAEKSGILKNATKVREAIDSSPSRQIAKSPISMVKAYDDVHLMNGQEIVEEIERSYNDVGVEETLIITRSNKRTNLYNQGIRSQLLWKENLLETGDRLMVSRNNYYFTQQYEGLPFLANGDMLEVVRLRNERELYGQHFVDASLKSLDYEWEVDVVIWLDTLTTDSPELNYPKQKELYAAIAEDYPEIHTKKELKEKILSSPYYNALQIRYAYAVTCHKAQGGQWKRVFIDPGSLGQPTPTDAPSVSSPSTPIEDLRWLYTALTRATEEIYLLRN